MLLGPLAHVVLAVLIVSLRVLVCDVGWMVMCVHVHVVYVVDYWGTSGR